MDALGLIGQVLDKMHAGEREKVEEPMRTMQDLTMEEAWSKASPVRTSPYARI